jgi:uncharacterized protein YyaL (SSP411 family)
MIFSRLRYRIKDLLPRQRIFTDRVHRQAAVSWLCRAQDALPDRGVSHSYLIGRGWMPSYPETTGYIIPTFIHLWRVTGDAELMRRAFEMAEWELRLQLDNGAIPDLISREPVVFDTGQVLFGWVSAYAESGDRRFIDAAILAGDWLNSGLDETGTWNGHGNLGTDGIHVYNVRVAWALVVLAQASGEARFADAARRFIDWVLQQEEEPGWFRKNCLNDNDHPLLHTIAYTSQGLLESGILLGDDRCMDAARRISLKLKGQVEADGRMAGRFDRFWKPSVTWSCLTGMAQTAIVWQRLDRLDGRNVYTKEIENVVSFLKRTHDLQSADDGVRGGVKGSFPVNGGYGTYRLLNWAAKFFVDALLLREFPETEFPLY